MISAHHRDLLAGEASEPKPLELPASLEEVFLEEDMDLQKLAGYALSQAEAGAVPFMKMPSALHAERAVRKNFVLSPRQPVAQDRPQTVPVEAAEGDAKLLLQEAVRKESDFWSERSLWAAEGVVEQLKLIDLLAAIDSRHEPRRCSS